MGERSRWEAESIGTSAPGGLAHSQQIIPGSLFSLARREVAVDAHAQTNPLDALCNTGDKDSQREGK